VEQRDVLRHDRHVGAQAVLRDLAHILPVDGDAAALDIVEALQQRQHGGLAGAREAHQADALTRLDRQVEAVQHRRPAGIGETHVLEAHAAGAGDEFARIRPVGQLVVGQQRADRFLEPREMLGQIDQCDGEIARAVQDAEGQRGDQHDVADRRLTVLPQHQRPADDAGGQDRGQHRVDQPQPLHVQKARAARCHLAAQRAGEPLLLAQGGAERPHHAEIADHVDQFAVNRGGLAGEVAMQRGAVARHVVDEHAECRGDGEQAGRHDRIDRADQQDRTRYRDAGRQHVPGHGVRHREGGVRGGGDAARQRAGQALGEVGRRVAAEMVEHVAADVAGDTDEGARCGDAADTPHQIVRRDQAAQQTEPDPHSGFRSCIRAMRDDVDKILQAVLRRDCRNHGQQHRYQHDGVADRVSPYVVEQEAERTHAGERLRGRVHCRGVEGLDFHRRVIPCVVSVQPPYPNGKAWRH
jgi:hypothetical protein